MADRNMIAVDIGAGSGRMMLGTFDGRKLKIAEKYRFTHEPVSWNTDVYWNFLAIWNAVRAGMRAVSSAGVAVDSIGFDSFAPDFGLFHSGSAVIPNFLSYRSVMGTDIRNDVFEKASAEEIFFRSGLQYGDVLMLPQLLYLLRTGRGYLLQDTSLLPVVNALVYLLTGQREVDHTVASISYFWNAAENGYDTGLGARYFESLAFMPPVMPAQRKVGRIGGGAISEGFQNAEVVSVGAHDTAVAMYALNCAADGGLCLNCGTWTAIGIVRDLPVMSKTAFELGFTNYGLPDGRYIFGNDMLGLFYIQKCRAELAERGQTLTYAELSGLAAQADVFALDIDDELFLKTEGALLPKIDEYFQRNGNRAPRSAGEYARCILEGLTEKYRKLIDAIETAAGVRYPEIFMGGGGIYDRVLCKLLEEKTGKKVRPVAAEATALGNMASQLIAFGDAAPGEIAEIIGSAEEI